MPRIKICGITRPMDAVVAAAAGADAVGLVFAKSRRQVTVARARQIVSALPPFVSAVGVFVNARPTTILHVVEATGLGEVQLHGDETAETIAQFPGIRVIKALRVRSKTLLDDLNRYRDAGVAGILLDAFSATARGGTGKRFDWDLLVEARRAGALEGAPPIILAGGLTPQNVRAGIRTIRPWGVDVSGGVETAPGTKSAKLIERFIAAVRSA